MKMKERKPNKKGNEEKEENQQWVSKAKKHREKGKSNRIGRYIEGKEIAERKKKERNLINKSNVEKQA